MNENTLHIIITSETGTGRTLLVKKKNIRNLIFSGVLLTVLLCTGTISGLHHWKDKRILQNEVASLNQTLQTDSIDLQRELAATKAELAKKRQEKLELVDRYENQVAKLKNERDELFEGSISRLDERSKIIKKLMDQIGVDIVVENDPDHSGGLYIDQDTALCDKLLCETDRYLPLIKKLPLGRPIGTKISSKYGPRSDPFNHKKAFHTGIDFKGKTGDKVQATGDGVVKRSSYNKGLGNNVVLRHGNGYETLYAHLSKRLVKRGEKVSRGQSIGLVGNTGRSTGSHLHYEVHYQDKTVDPMKFMQVAKLLADK